MSWVYLSPHFDDVVLSCGGLVWEQVQSGESVEIWTICAGAPQEGEPLSAFAHALHARWQTGLEAVPARRREDEAAVAVLGARLGYWDLPDCIYRRMPDGTFLVNGEADLWQPVHPQETGVVERLKDWMSAQLDETDCLVSPMTLGNHVDHHLVRAAAEGLGREIWYYADYPYAVQQPQALAALVQPDWHKEYYSIAPQGLAAWQDAVNEYTSQISTFWNGAEKMRAELKSYWEQGGGSCLWRSTGNISNAM